MFDHGGQRREEVRVQRSKRDIRVDVGESNSLGIRADKKGTGASEDFLIPKRDEEAVRLGLDRNDRGLVLAAFFLPLTIGNLLPEEEHFPDSAFGKELVKDL